MGLALIAAAAGLAAQELSSPAETGAFIAALEACTPAAMRTPHPLMKTFVVDHTIAGEESGACQYRQTMPGKMTMACALTPAGRKLLAADMKVMTSGGPMRGGTGQPQSEWFKECEIELPNGNRIPAAQSK